MKALVYRGPGALVLEQRAQPHPGRGEVLLRVDACSICGTDLRILAGEHRSYVNGIGRVPGHEVVGTVTDLGEGAAGGLGVGDTVFVAPNFGCGNCKACSGGQVNLCVQPRAIGINQDGGFADYLLLARDLVEQGNLMAFAAPSDVAVMALAEPLACALRGSRACDVRPGDVVIVYGAGPIGLFHVALARLAGAGAILVCDPNSPRRRRAVEWGALVAVEEQHELAPALTEAGALQGADVVIVAAPAPAAQVQAIELAGPKGRVNYFAGLPRAGSRVEIDTNLIHYKELVITGTTASTNQECQAALELLVSGRIDAGGLIDARFDLTSAKAAFDLAASGEAMKVMIQP